MNYEDIRTIISTIVVIGIASFIYYTHNDKPEAAGKETTYITEDKQHHGCLKRTETYLLKPDTWRLVCPDGFVQHGGNYYIEKD